MTLKRVNLLYWKQEASNCAELFGKTGSWQSFKTKKIGFINLSAGTHKLVFKPASQFETIGDKGALLDLRGLKLVRLNDPSPKIDKFCYCKSII